MQNRNNPASQAVVRWGILATGTLAALIGAFWLVAWLAGYGARWSAAGDLTVKANTGLALLLGGCALLLLGMEKPGRFRRLVAVVFSACVLLIGALTLSEHLFGWNLGTDQLLAKEAPGAVYTVSPNRPGPPASLCFTLLGMALLALAFRRRAIVLYLGLTICIINLVPAIGFLYGIGQFYDRPHLTHIAWPTVIALLSLGMGLIMTRSDRGPMALLLRDDPGGALLRRMLPVVVLVPLIFGFLRIQGELRGLYGVAEGTGMLMIALILVFSSMLWRNARDLSRSAQAQRAGEEDRERLLAEIERRAAEMDVTLDSMVDGLSITEAGGRVLRMNAAAERMFGMTAEEMSSSIPERLRQLRMTKPDGTPMLPEESPTYRVSQGETVSGLVEVLHLPGGALWLSVNAAPIIALDGTQLGVVTTFSDITARVQAEEALRESAQSLQQAQELLEAVTKGTEVIMAAVDTGFRYAFFNKAYQDEVERLSGRVIQVGTSVVETFAHMPEQQKVILDEWSTVLRGESSSRRLEFGDPGRYSRVYSVLHTPIRDAEGNVVGAGEVAYDITEQVLAEKALAQSRNDLNRAQAVAHTGSWRLDVRRNVLEWSEENHRIFGIPEGTPTTYETFLSCVHPDDREYVDREWVAALRGEPYDIEHRIIVGDTVKWVRETAVLELDEDGALVGGFGTTQDITERKRAEEALLQAEENKAEFYKRTLVAATGGKLVVTDRGDIERIAGSVAATWEISKPEDLRTAREGVGEAALAAGMDPNRAGKLQVCVGEAATNALKHGGGGMVALHRSAESLTAVISDVGPGIHEVSLPDVALTPGYTTAGTLGMGYKVIISFADKVYLATESNGTTVAIQIRLRPEPESPSTCGSTRVAGRDVQRL